MRRIRRNLQNLPKEEQNLLIFILDTEWMYFTINDLRTNLDLEVNDLQNAIENLAVKGFINRIEKGKYCFPTFRNEFVIGNILMPEGAIAYWSALHWFNLTEQIPNTIFIQTPKTKRETEVFNVRYKFIKVKFPKFDGIITKGYGQEKFNITELEKTILDCFDLPQYAPSFDALIEAVANIDGDEDKLIKYSEIINNISAIKRLAVITEIVHGNRFQKFLTYAIKKVNPRYITLDPFGLDEGEFWKKWRIRMNMTKDEILSIAMQEY